MSDFIKKPKVKPRGGEKKLQISKNKALYAKAKEKKTDGKINLSNLIKELNARKGVEISAGVTASTLKGVGKKIAGVIPLVGTKTKKD
jgi:hypothetical protein